MDTVEELDTVLQWDTVEELDTVEKYLHGTWHWITVSLEIWKVLQVATMKRNSIFSGTNSTSAAKPRSRGQRRLSSSTIWLRLVGQFLAYYCNSFRDWFESLTGQLQPVALPNFIQILNHILYQQESYSSSKEYGSRWTYYNFRKRLRTSLTRKRWRRKTFSRPLYRLKRFLPCLFPLNVYLVRNKVCL